MTSKTDFSFISLHNCAAFCFRHINSDVNWRSEPVWYKVTYNDIQPWEALGRAEYQILQVPACCNYYYWIFVELSTATPRDIDIHPKSSRCSPIWIGGQLGCANDDLLLMRYHESRSTLRQQISLHQSPRRVSMPWSVTPFLHLLIQNLGFIQRHALSRKWRRADVMQMKATSCYPD